MSTQPPSVPHVPVEVLHRRAVVELELTRTDALIEYREHALAGARKLAEMMTGLAECRFLTLIEEELAKQSEARARVELANLAVEQKRRALATPPDGTLLPAQHTATARLKQQLAESEAANERLRRQLFEEDDDL